MGTQGKPKNWKRVSAAKIARLTPERAGEIYAAVNDRTRREGATIHHDEIRALTGGYASQAINFLVLRMLAIRAGMIRG